MILDGTQGASVQAAAVALQRGELLGLPTETVYGLAANSDNDAAVAQIFTAKGRPANHPLIVHVAAIQKIFKKMYDNGDIYKGKYVGKYCKPCESFWFNCFR